MLPSALTPVMSATSFSNWAGSFGAVAGAASAADSITEAADGSNASSPKGDFSLFPGGFPDGGSPMVPPNPHSSVLALLQIATGALPPRLSLTTDPPVAASSGPA